MVDIDRSMVSFVDDGRRVNYSAGISMSLHGLIFGIYLFLKLTKPADTHVVLTRVEFMDLKTPPPAVEAAPEPAMARPRGVRDFLRMAIPKFTRPQPQETPQEPKMAKDISSAMMPQTKQISLDHDKPLLRGASLRIKTSDAPIRGASFNDIAVKTHSPDMTDMQTTRETKTISIDAVGRRAVRSAGGGSIRIDAGGSLTPSGSFKDIKGPTAPSGTAPSLRETGGGIQIKDEAVGGRRGAMPPSSLPIGYGRGSGEISLSDRPVARARMMQALPEAAPQKVQSKVKTDALERVNKALEISGPLAGRKIIYVSLPKYPEWAKMKGVEADVVIRFYVDRDGAVLERMVLERTSGYEELDQLGMEALKKMVFVPLPKGQEEDQWGIITFRFRLK